MKERPKEKKKEVKKEMHGKDKNSCSAKSMKMGKIATAARKNKK